MRPKILVFASIFSITSLLFLCSLSFATKSRLSGMGELSIVIEDESNMISLWDFAGNPAGFLADEKGSVIRGDFLWERYKITNLRHYDYRYNAYSEYHANGDVFDHWLSASFRREGDFALGAEGNYLSRETDSRYHKNEYAYPKVLLVFSKSMNSRTSFGVSLKYLEYDSEWNDKIYHYEEKYKFDNLRAEIGVGRKFLSGVMLGALLGYDSVEPDEDSDLSDSYSIWLSGQTAMEIEQKLKLGLETIFKLEKADFMPSKSGKESYYTTSLRFRGIYDLSPEFRIGLFYFDKEFCGELFDPLDSYYWLFPYGIYVRHWGAGCSYKFGGVMLAGVEYHFKDSSRPRSSHFDPNYKDQSLNVGLEGKLSEVSSLRGGYIRTETSRNPNYYHERGAWENALTLGFGYEPYEWNFVLEFSYRYAFKKFKEFFESKDVKSERHVLSLSLKKVL